MAEWFECKVKFEKTLEDGIQKKVTEAYLVDALSFTEAEKRIINEMTPFITGEFEVNAVKKDKISELFYDENGDKWYRAKINFVTLDEKSGVEKRSASTMMIQASDFKKAIENLECGMKGTMSDWEIASVSETAIIDIFNYKENGEEEE